jgi:hypothetical protein
MRRWEKPKRRREEGGENEKESETQRRRWRKSRRGRRGEMADGWRGFRRSDDEECRQAATTTSRQGE